MKPGVATRVAAATMLSRVLDEGAFSNRIVTIDTAGLDDRDRRFSQHLLFTTLRDLPRIDRVIEGFAGRAPTDLDPEVRSVLRVGLAELMSSSEADHAAVDSAVEAVRAMGAGRAAGFVNALLRRFTREGEPPIAEGTAATALHLGVPEWLYQRITRALGEGVAERMLRGLRSDPAIGVRLRRPVPGVTVEPIEGLQTTIGYAEPSAELTAAFDGGAAVAIDPASSAVAESVEARPGERILDLAAAPGGKTVHLFDQMGGDGVLVAADRHHRRAIRARRRLRRIGVDVPWIVMDGLAPAVAPGWDAVLVDAPCTGLGTLRRRPEIVRRLTPDAPDRMAALQARLLDRAVRLARPGGRVVYSVCTLFPEETVDVVESFPAGPPAGVPGVRWGKGVLLGPHSNGTDAMFISVIRT